MVRLFQTHKIRETVELDGLWEFTPLGDGEAMPTVYPYAMPVPGCWETHPSFAAYRGRAAYRKVLQIDGRTSLRFEFKGVSHTADVYFDGKLICHHYNAYTPFSFFVTDAEAGEHALTVVVDNAFSGESALHIGNDYYTYGGIIRPVAMEKVGGVYIERLEFHPFLRDGIWNADIKVFVRNIGDVNRAIRAEGKLHDKSFAFAPVQICREGVGTLSGSFAFDGVEPWNADHPRLYGLEVRLLDDGDGAILDDLIERVGFRAVAVEDGELRVNGACVMLKGFNRHEDHGVCGCALPFQLMVKDIELMQAAGANAVRTSHYPNDERFLDLCDERGIYVWEENHARGLTLEHMDNPNFEPQCEACNQEMVQNHFNHPCIVIWGLLNECASDSQRGREMFKRQYGQIRAMDASRPVSHASNKPYTDVCLDLPDIVSFNIYSGWYDRNDIADEYLNIRAWAEENGAKGKPYIVSEFGAGAIYGFRDPAKTRWSEENQVDILGKSLDVYLGRPEIKGVFIWQFCDCRVTEENGWAMARPASRNNKGIVDTYRRPKLAYGTVDELYHSHNREALP